MGIRLPGGNGDEPVLRGHDDLLEHYAWYPANSGDPCMARCGRLLPNDLGLFDMLGNVYEWCQERYEPGAREQGESTI